MSKISDALEAARKEHEAKFSTIEDFAKELNKSTEALTEQLRSAGVKNLLPTDRLSEADKRRLLTYLQRSHGNGTRQRKIKLLLESAETSMLKKIAANANGAEWELLEKVAELVVCGEGVNASTQKVANFLIAKIVLTGALPDKKRGRPKNEKLAAIGREIAEKYWEIRDSGVSYQQSVTALSQSFHKDERHIMRIVEKHKMEVGATYEARESKRAWTKLMREMYQRNPNMYDHYHALIAPKESLPEFTLEDYLDHINEGIATTAAQCGVLTLKG